MSVDDGKKFIVGSISLVLAIIFFGGFIKDIFGGIFDFSVLGGTLPKWFKATEGASGARAGFIFAFTLLPTVMLALGFVAIFEHFGALKAASKLLTPILKPIMGIPGTCSISLVASLQSTDAGSSTTQFLREEGKITNKELLIFSAFQFSAGAMITNFLSSFAPLLSIPDTSSNVASVSIALCFGIIFSFKIIGANIMRLYVAKFVKEEE